MTAIEYLGRNLVLQASETDLRAKYSTPGPRPASFNPSINREEICMPKTMTAGGAIFSRLKVLGVDYVFANSGTDFPPIIEAFCALAEEATPVPVTVPVRSPSALMEPMP